MKIVEIKSKEEIREYLNEIYFDATDEDFLYIEPQFNDVVQSINFFSKIDTTNVEEANWPFDVSTTYLREDEETMTLTNEEALQNAPETQDGYVKYIKVVK